MCNKSQKLFRKSTNFQVRTLQTSIPCTSVSFEHNTAWVLYKLPTNVTGSISFFFVYFLCHFMPAPRIGVGKGVKEAMPPKKVLENIVILCFQRGFSKQNNVIRVKSNMLLPQTFGLAAPLAPRVFAARTSVCFANNNIFSRINKLLFEVR